MVTTSIFAPINIIITQLKTPYQHYTTMCGIFGILNNNNASVPVPADTVEQCFYMTKPRGPEYSALNDYNVATTLGFHRLAINGLDPGSHQPFNLNGVHLVCNGEIYNYLDLYKLTNTTPTTHSDCEVIIHLYLKYGIEQCLRMLDGYYAFILYDTNTNTLITARDLFGIRPLFMAETERTDVYSCDYESSSYYRARFYAFASEMKSLSGLLKSGTIEQHKPGTYSVYQLKETGKVGLHKAFYNHTKDEFETPKYWSCTQKEVRWGVIGSITPTENLVDVKMKSDVFSALKNAVIKRVKSTERKIACLLSGGLDSSLITALVCKYGVDYKVETYSIGLADSEDLKYARIVADHLNTNHHEIIVTEREFLDAIPEVIKAIESYDTTTVRASVGNYLVAKYISEHSDAKVIFNGDGADELMGGYLYMSKAPDCVEFDRECVRLLNNIHYFDVLRSDRSVASNGLEARTPYLDAEFAQLYLSLSPQVRFHTMTSNCEKYIIRQMVRNEMPGLLPSIVLNRRKEAFSDGVSNQSRSWYQIIQEHMDALDIDTTRKYEHNQPTTKEQYYYRALFDKFYPNCAHLTPYFWMPKYVPATDASARSLDIYNTNAAPLHATI